MVTDLEKQNLQRQIDEINEFLKRPNLGRNDIYPKIDRRERLQTQLDEREVLSPAAVQTLFGISDSRVRQAVLGDNVEVPFKLKITGKYVSLINLNSAIEYWHTPDQSVLQQMREIATTISVYGQGYAILHTERLVG